jgi:hypothetical protein
MNAIQNDCDYFKSIPGDEALDYVLKRLYLAVKGNGDKSNLSLKSVV